MRFTNEINFPSLPSTNTFLKENYQDFPNYTVVTAKTQTAGRGRLGRGWFSGDDLMLSVLIKDALDPQEIPKISLVAAASAWKTLSPLLAVEIKWPNDITCEGKKITGILTETVICSQKLAALVIGFGINVNTVQFPEELEDKATSLALETGWNHDVGELKKKLLENLDLYYQNFLECGKEYLDICRENSALIGKEVIIDDFKTQKSAKVLAILENGNILLEIGNEKIEYASGEITLKEVYRGR